MKTVSKKRKDIALTQKIALSITERIQSGLPLLSRASNNLLLNTPELANTIPKGTYNSWRTRGTIPVDSTENKGLDEIVAEARNKRDEDKLEELLDLGEAGFREILKMSYTQKTIEKRINKYGKEYSRIIRTEISPVVVSAKVKVITSMLGASEKSTYGRSSNARKQSVMFSLADLRRKENEYKLY